MTARPRKSIGHSCDSSVDACRHRESQHNTSQHSVHSKVPWHFEWVGQAPHAQVCEGDCEGLCNKLSLCKDNLLALQGC